MMVQVQPLVKDDLKVEWYWVCLRGLLWKWMVKDVVLLWTSENGLVKWRGSGRSRLLLLVVVVVGRLTPRLRYSCLNAKHTERETRSR